ncbi:melanopsin-like [Rhopilema esculentum]|uniref:melanopsin-like n=1 Tax=Rhopilema esculentum TaxID=499914 RepID=UPI0031D647BA|eukprot:gene16727-8180_t
MSEEGLLFNVIVSGIISILGTFGNASVMYVFIKIPSLRTVNNIFVMQLAAIDLLKSSVVIPIKVANHARKKSFMDPTVCPIVGMLRVICSCQSVLLLAAIASVRFWKVVHPHRFHIVFSRKRTIVYSLSLATGTMLLSLLPVFGIGEYAYSSSHGACFVNWSSKNIVFRSIYYSINVGITLPILVYCYYRIYRLLRSHRSRATEIQDKSIVARDHILDLSRPSVGDLQIPAGRELLRTDATKYSPIQTRHSPGLRERLNSSRSDKLKRGRSDFEVAVTKVMFIIVVVYVVCWTPALVTNILNLSKVVKFPADFLLLIVCLVDLKVVLNPLIYLLSHKRFRLRAIRAFEQLHKD